MMKLRPMQMGRLFSLIPEVAQTVGFIYLGAFGSFFWLDAIYGVGVAYGLSKLVVHWLA